MARSEAETPEQYLEELPPERRDVVARVLDLIRTNLPEGYEEGMEYGMISWSVPLERYPDTYNGRPLSYLALAAQKRHYALYAHGLYMDEERKAAFETAWRETGHRLDMGKSCIRFRTLEEVPMGLVGEMVAGMPVADFLERYESVKG